jgi:hypothetical protein
MEYRLKPEYIKRITEDGLLYGKVAHAMGINGPSLAIPLRKNSTAFTQKKILKLLSDHLGVSENDLVEEVEESEPENA